MSGDTWHSLATWIQLGLAALTAISLVFITAPYGRHRRHGWGPEMSTRVGWVVMESPTIVVFGAIYLMGSQRAAAVPMVLAAGWLVHYGYRTTIYPRLVRGQAHKTMPILVVTLGVAFNCLNAYINARWISQLGSYPTSWFSHPAFLIGAAVFLAGFATHVWSDRVLRHLREPGETGYRIPTGGLYDSVSCPNYLGEIIQWCGWAIATWSLPGLAFAAYTAANLAPRANAHHTWYQDTFPEYPNDRRRLLPHTW